MAKAGILFSLRRYSPNLLSDPPRRVADRWLMCADRREAGLGRIPGPHLTGATDRILLVIRLSCHWLLVKFWLRVTVMALIGVATAADGIV